MSCSILWSNGYGLAERSHRFRNHLLLPVCGTEIIRCGEVRRVQVESVLQLQNGPVEVAGASISKSQVENRKRIVRAELQDTLKFLHGMRIIAQTVIIEPQQIMHGNGVGLCL